VSFIADFVLNKVCWACGYGVFEDLQFSTIENFPMEFMTWHIVRPHRFYSILVVRNDNAKFARFAATVIPHPACVSRPRRPFVRATLRANPNVDFYERTHFNGVPKSREPVCARTSGMTSLTLESATIDPIKLLCTLAHEIEDLFITSGRVAIS